MEKKSRLGFHFKRLSHEKALEASQLYESGLSTADVASFFGVSRSAMYDLLKRRVQMRPQRRVGPENHFFRGGYTADQRCHDLVEKAVEKGILKRPIVCSVCGGCGPQYIDGRSAIQAHHDDYNRPLAIRWLCQPCHHEWHTSNTPIAKYEK